MVPPEQIKVRCPGCGVRMGEAHNRACMIPICSVCGEPLNQCGHFPEGNTVWNGIQHREEVLVAELLGLFVKWTGSEWVTCPPEDPGARYDLVRASMIIKKALRKIRGKM